MTEAERIGLKNMPTMKVVIEHPHKCNCIAKAPNVAEGREWWVGELTEKLEEYPHETHCFHTKTPTKEVVYLFNEADFRMLIILSESVIGRQNESWLDTMVDAAKKKR